MKSQKPQKSHHNVEGEEQLGELTLPNVSAYYKATVMKTVLTKEETNTLVEQNRETRKDLYKYSQLLFDKGAKAIY